MPALQGPARLPARLGFSRPPRVDPAPAVSCEGRGAQYPARPVRKSRLREAPGLCFPARSDPRSPQAQPLGSSPHDGRPLACLVPRG